MLNRPFVQHTIFKQLFFCFYEQAVNKETYVLFYVSTRLPTIFFFFLDQHHNLRCLQHKVLASFNRFISGFFFTTNEAQRAPNNGANHCLFPDPSLDFPPFTPDSYFISKQLDFRGIPRTNKYLPFPAYIFCVYFSIQLPVFKLVWWWQGSSGNLSLDINGVALKCR